LFPLTLWLRRSDPAAPAAIRVHGSGIRVQVGEGAAQAGRDLTLQLPAGDDPLPVQFSRPEPGEIPGSWYPQDIHLELQGSVLPYWGVAPGRMLAPSPD